MDIATFGEEGKSFPPQGMFPVSRAGWVGRKRASLEEAAAVAVLAIGPSAHAFAAQPFPDADAYWAAPIEIEGDARHHHPLTRDLAPSACAICHPRQYQDWRESLHAQAVSPGFLGQLNALTFGERRSCFACHVPPADRQDAWEARGVDARAELHGIDCASCHVRNQQRFGPRERPDTPHGEVAKLDFFRGSEFCAPCHQFGPNGVAVNGKLLQNTHEEWSGSPQAGEGESCQTCHMPDGSHRFAGIHDPAMTARGLRVTANRTADGVEVTVSNRGAGHALPTYAVPRIRVVVSTPGQDALDYSIQRRMDWDADHGWRELADTRLMPGEVVSLEQTMAAGAEARVSVHVEPDADYFDRVYPAMLEMLADEVPREDLDLLEKARQRAGDSPYVLLRLHCAGWRGENAPCVTVVPPAGTPARSGAADPTPG